MSSNSLNRFATLALDTRFESTIIRQLQLLSDQFGGSTVVLYSGLSCKAWYSRKDMPDADAELPQSTELDECFRRSQDGVVVFDDARVASCEVVRKHPWINGVAAVRSVAAVRLYDRAGRLTGCLALLDQRPCKKYSVEQRQMLAEWAGVLSAQLRLRRSCEIRDPTTGLFTRHYLVQKLDYPATRAEVRWLVTADLLGPEVVEEMTSAQGYGYVEELCRQLVAGLRSELSGNPLIFSISVSQIALLYRDLDATELESGMKQLSLSIDRHFEALVESGLAPRMSIGATRVTDVPAEELLRQARFAMQQAHDMHQYGCVYEERSDARRQRRFSILTELPAALKSDDQLYLEYQPQIDMDTGHCHGLETLLRWHNPTLGQVSPLELIHAAETSVLMKPLTDWVLDQAMRDAAIWRRAGLMKKVAVNLSAYDLMDLRLLDRVRAALARHDLPGTALELEFTETSLVSDIDAALPNLLALHELGVSTAVDDFGTGYCNLSYLSRLPALTVKIDRSFIAMLDDEDARGHQLTRGVIELVHSLDFRTIAEGIETRASGRKVAEWGCTSGQGYFISKPMRADHATTWLRETAAVQFAA